MLAPATIWPRWSVPSNCDAIQGVITKSVSRREMLKVLYPVVEVPTDAAGKKAGTKKIDLTQKLFDEYGTKYAGRKGGYTRIIKIGQRKGDQALEVILELV